MIEAVYSDSGHYIERLTARAGVRNILPGLRAVERRRRCYNEDRVSFENESDQKRPVVNSLAVFVTFR